MKVKTTHTVTHTLCLDGNIEVKLDFEPLNADQILVERVGDKLIVGYLSHDDDGGGCNPLTDHDGNGKVYLRGRDQFERGDDHRMMSALKLDAYGNVDYDEDLVWNGETITLRELAARMRVGGTFDEIQEKAEDFYRGNWREIVGPYVVPISYGDYGSSGVVMRTTDWDGNIDRLPDGVWVPCDNALENLTYEGNVPTREEIDTYAENVVSEYQKWANGEVYGVVVETFDVAPHMHCQQIDGDACWGYCGYDYARETLKTEFDTAVKRIKGGDS